MLLDVNTLISIIIPCYNQSAFLDECLKSILNQSYTNWECLIVNDGSTDNTSKIANSWCTKDNRFRLIEKINGGLSSARNSGIQYCKGELIQFLDADDLIEPEKLKHQSQILLSNEHIDIVYSPVRYFASENLNIKYKSLALDNKEWQPKFTGSNEVVFLELLKGNIFACNCPLIKKTALNKTGLFNESLKTHEDYEFWIRMAISGLYFHSDCTPATFALVRVHQLSMSNNKEQMNNGFLLSKLLLLNFLVKKKYLVQLNNERELRNIKKTLFFYQAQGKIEYYQFKEILNNLERKKLAMLKFLPLKMMSRILFFNIFDSFSVIRNFFI